MLPYVLFNLLSPKHFSSAEDGPVDINALHDDHLGPPQFFNILRWSHSLTKLFKRLLTMFLTRLLMMWRRRLLIIWWE